MAINVGGHSKTGSGRLGSGLTSMAEINVTPLVDVMMVLLIVFMISAPMMQQGVQVDLPKANAGALNDVPEQLVLVVNRSHQVQINGNSIPRGGLREKLIAIHDARPDVQIYIQADQGVAYGFVAEVMAEIKQAKISRIGLVTDPAEKNSNI